MTSDTNIRLRREGPIAVLLLCVAVWYFRSLSGALSTDEVIYAKAGWFMFHGNPYLNPTHIFAPAAKVFIGLGQIVAGRTSVGARAPVALLGVATVYLTYRLGTLVRGRLVGLLAATLLAATHHFSVSSVTAMLDVPLAFFLTAAVYATTRWFRDQEARYAVVAGGSVALVGITKAQGFLYVAPVVGAGLLAILRRTRRDALETLRLPVAGGVLTCVVFYLPIILGPLPPVPDEYATPMIRVVLNIPVVGNLAYVFGAAIVKNFPHLGSGHAVEVGNAVYQTPPFWSYVYWLYEQGGIPYLGALVLSAASIAHWATGALQRGTTTTGDPTSEFPGEGASTLLLDATVLGALTAVSAMTVKFPRYLVPLFPLLAVAGVAHARSLVSVVRWHLADTASSERTSRGQRLEVVALIVLLLLVSIVPPSPVVASATQPIGTDTGYDQAAMFVDRYADQSDERLRVFAYHKIILDYYLESSDVTVVDFTPNDIENDTKYRAFHDRIQGGEVDLIITVERNPRLRDEQPNLYQYVRSQSDPLLAVPMTPNGNTLVVYHPENATALPNPVDSQESTAPASLV